MASIKKRNKSYSVIYTYLDKKGQKSQKWESYKTHKEALERKAEVERQLENNEFILPSDITIAKFMWDYIKIIGKKKWQPTTYTYNEALVRNYIEPLIGNKKVQKFTPYDVDKYVNVLEVTPSANNAYKKSANTFVSPNVIEKIIKLLCSAFKMAKRWNIITFNPFEETILPDVIHEETKILTVTQIQKALEYCTDNRLFMAMNLSFSCSLRLGEVLGMLWKNVHVSEELIAEDKAYVYIEPTLARLPLKTLEEQSMKDIIKVFPPQKKDATTRLVLKKPKTKNSKTKVYLPKTLAYILLEWKKSQEITKKLLGEEYYDYGLVVALSDGKPCESKIIEKSFNKLKKKAELPNVKFHSLRHSSTTYKLKINKGDIKATQGDTGHATPDMVTKVYAHILDEDRQVNAQKFESLFYSTPNLKQAQLSNEVQDSAVDTKILDLVNKLQQNPDLVNILGKLLTNVSN